jgi:hypothetical protein
MSMTVAQYITSALNAYTGGLNQTELAKAAGFENPNFLSMIKNGRAKLLLARVVPLCDVIGTEPEELLLLVLGETHPDPEDNPLWIAWGGRIPTVSGLRSVRTPRP